MGGARLGVQRSALLISSLNFLAASTFSLNSVFLSSVHLPVITSSGVAPFKAEWGIQVLLSWRGKSTPFAKDSKLERTRIYKYKCLILWKRNSTMELLCARSFREGVIEISSDVTRLSMTTSLTFSLPQLTRRLGLISRPSNFAVARAVFRSSLVLTPQKSLDTFQATVYLK